MLHYYLVDIHFAPDELWPPKLQGLLQREANPFEEEAVLHSPSVAEMVVLSQGLMKLPHAQRERLPRELQENKVIMLEIFSSRLVQTWLNPFHRIHLCLELTSWILYYYTLQSICTFWNYFCKYTAIFTSSKKCLAIHTYKIHTLSFVTHQELPTESYNILVATYWIYLVQRDFPNILLDAVILAHIGMTKNKQIRMKTVLSKIRELTKTS